MWVDKTVAYFFILKIFKKNRCGYFYSMSYSVHQDVLCDAEIRSGDFLCEFDLRATDLGKEGGKGISDTQHFIERPNPQNKSFSVPVVKCPAGHVTHAFLACDESSACWSSHDRYTKSDVWEIPSRQTCLAIIAPLPAMFVCTSGVQRVPYTFVCDHRPQCSDSSDENFCIFSPCAGTTPVQCVTSKKCVSLSALCNYQGDCKHSADEAVCYDVSPRSIPPPAIVHFSPSFKAYKMTKFQSMCPETHIQCHANGYCLPLFIMCNGVNDCPGREDEVGCDTPTCTGLYRCRGSKVCLHPNHVCDGRYQCPQQDDEILCRVTCPAGCTCRGLEFICHQPLYRKMHSDVRYLDARNSGMTPADLTESKMLIYLSLSECRLKDVSNMTFHNLLSLDLSHNNLYTTNTVNLQGMVNLRFLSVSNNPLKSLFSLDQNQIAFPTLKSLDMSGVKMQKVNTQSFSLFTGLEILNLSHCGVDQITGGGLRTTNKLRVLDTLGCPIIQFPRDFISGLRELQTVQADNFKLCCHQTLPPGFNLVNCRAPFDEVSSCESMLRSDIYVVFLSMFSGIALLGNLVCFLTKMFSFKNSISGFTVFVTHLCISDFLMGVYLAIIGVADRLYKGSYLWEDYMWRHSVACEVAGFLSLLSSEMSAFTICLITLDRFLVLRFPFSSLHFKARSAHVTCAVVWAAVMAMAAAPLTPMTSHWLFFSQTGICIPLPVTRKDFPGRLYSFGVLIVLNFILFLLIAVGQAIIYVSIQANRLSTTDSSKKSTDLRIARRLISVAVSDFMCWFPIGMLGLLASRGVPIPGEVNVVMAIMVLPLNSSLNPFLYTINIMLERRQRLRDEKFLKRLIAQLYDEKGKTL